MGTQNGYGIKIFPNKEIVVSGLFPKWELIKIFPNKEIVVNGLLKKGPIRDEEKKIPPRNLH